MPILLSNDEVREALDARGYAEAMEEVFTSVDLSEQRRRENESGDR